MRRIQAWLIAGYGKRSFRVHYIGSQWDLSLIETDQSTPMGLRIIYETNNLEYDHAVKVLAAKIGT